MQSPSAATAAPERPGPPLDADSTALMQAFAGLAAEYLESLTDPSTPVVRYARPEELGARIPFDPPRTGRDTASLIESMRATLRHSVRTGHSQFANQLFGGFDVPAIVGEWMTALLNTSMYTYEVAPVVTLMEAALIRHMCALAGWSATEGEGVFTPGGSLANLMALLAARHRRFPEVKAGGLRADDRPLVLMSREAHYSVQRAASVAGLGAAGVVLVDVDGLGRMQPGAAEAALVEAVGEGRTPLFVCATASTTVAGAFDPIDDLADLAERFGAWLHVDAASGGSVLLSPRHSELMNGCRRADSITWNPHKMMGLPLICSVLLVRERGRLAATNAMGADYLFHPNEDAGNDLGDLSLQCGRRVDSLKLWLSWQAAGDEGHARRVDALFDLARRLRDMIVAREGFELVREPQACNVCFHFVPRALRDRAPGPERRRLLGEATVRIREDLRRAGRLLINYAPLDGVPVFRYVASNQRTRVEDLRFLLDEIERVGEVPLAGLSRLPHPDPVQVTP